MNNFLIKRIKEVQLGIFLYVITSTLSFNRAYLKYVIFKLFVLINIQKEYFAVV